MKKRMIMLFLLLAGTEKCFTQKVQRGPEDVGYMGLNDFNLALGRHNYQAGKEATTLQPFSSEIKTEATYFLFHLQDGMLSNYFWSMNDDKRIKFGISETLELGYMWGNRNEVYTQPGVETQSYDYPVKKFIGAYELGVGIIFRLGVKMDAGFTYYPFIASNFTEYERYGKFRFRYDHYLIELSTLGKNAIDIRYLKRIKEAEGTMNYFFGITVLKHKSYAAYADQIDQNRYMHVNFGLML